MDKLDQIFERQRLFDTELAMNRGLGHITAEEWIQKETLAMISELSELLDEVNFKWWKNPKPLDMPAIKEELVDILHFLVSMSCHCGMTAEEMHAIYIRKNQENFNRQRGLSDKDKEGYIVQTADKPVSPTQTSSPSSDTRAESEASK